MEEQFCRFCSLETVFFCAAPILNHIGQYFKCSNCSSVQVVDPFWLEEAHSSAISKFDTGLASRCISSANLIGTLLKLEGKESSTGIDWAGGTGLLTRLLRDQGFKIQSHDKYAHPVHAVGFEATDTHAKSDVVFVSAIECIEHLENPVDEIYDFTEAKDYFFFTIEIISPKTPDPSKMEWWYYMPDSGQHVTFPTLRGINFFKERLGFQYHFKVGSLQVFSKRRLKVITRILLKTRISSRLLIVIIPLINSRKYSLTNQDQKDLIARSKKTL
jgi:hypothetical protein